MITISIYGLDQYVVGRYSKFNTKNLASLLEVKEDDISFYAPNAYVFHNGVEQTSWNTIVKVNAPEQCESLEEKVAKYIIETIKDYTINVTVEFYYYHKHHRYEHLNAEYPHFITDDNVASVDEDDEAEEIYMGNIFEGMQDKLDEVYEQKEQEMKEEEDEDECCCGEGHCTCGHRHHD